jgi:hypothetical protein
LLRNILTAVLLRLLSMDLFDTVSNLKNGKILRKRRFFTMSSGPYEMCCFSERSIFASLSSSLDEFFPHTWSRRLRGIEVVERV